MHLPHLWPAIGSLLLMIVTAISLGAAAKTKVVKSGSVAFAILATMIFAYAIYSAVMFAFDHKGFFLLTILLCFVDFVFFLGCLLVCNQDMKFENGAVAIKKQGLLYRVIYVKSFGMRNREHLTLCSISWLGALVVIFFPLVYIAGHIVAFVLAVVIFLVAGQNPLLPNKCWNELITTDYCYTDTFETLWLGPVPASPLLLAAILGMIGFGAWGMTVLSLIWIVPIAVALLAVVIFPFLFAIAKIMDRQQEQAENRYLRLSEMRTEKVMIAPRAIGHGLAAPFIWVGKLIMLVLNPIVMIVGTLKKRACPTIVVKD